MGTLLEKNNTYTMDQISYEDFAKLQIAMGTIESVEIVEGADKLLKLMVAVGE